MACITVNFTFRFVPDILFRITETYFLIKTPQYCIRKLWYKTFINFNLPIADCCGLRYNTDKKTFGNLPPIQSQKVNSPTFGQAIGKFPWFTIGTLTNGIEFLMFFQQFLQPISGIVSKIRPHSLFNSLFIALKIEADTTLSFHNIIIKLDGKSDVWLTVHRNSVWIRKTN